MAIVYLHKRKSDQEVFYVGIGKDEKRAFSRHGRNKFWKRFTNKYEHFVEILCEELTWEEACEQEKELICFYGRRDLGFGSLVNLTDGGEGTIGLIKSEELRKSISERTKNNKHALGLKHSEETKRKLAELSRGNKYALGFLHSEETRKRMSISSSIPVEQYDLDGNFLAEFYGAKEAGKATSIDRSCITKVCKGKRRMAGGFIWKYKD